MKSLTFFFLSLIILSSLSSAMQLVVDNNYHPGQTMIAELKGNVISPITRNDVNFYSGRDILSLDYGIERIDGKYFIYASLPLEQGDYEVIISNVEHFEQGSERVSNVSANLSVNGSVADFSVSPGVIVTNKDFSLTVKNLGDDLSLTSSFNNKQLVNNIGYGKVKQLSFSTGSITNSGLYTLTLSSSGTTYSVPVYVISSSSNVSPSNNITKPFSIGPRDINLQIIKGVTRYVNLTIQNLDKELIDKVTISYSKDLSSIISFDSLLIENLTGFSVRNIPLKIVTPNRVDTFEGLITFFTENFSDSIKVFISSVNNLNSSATPKDNLTTGNLNSCVSMGGVLCFSDEICIGDYTNSIEGLCCLSQCSPNGKASGGGSASTIIIIIIVLVLLVVGYLFYKKYKESKGSSSQKITSLTKKFDAQYKGEGKK